MTVILNSGTSSLENKAVKTCVGGKPGAAVPIAGRKLLQGLVEEFSVTETVGDAFSAIAWSNYASIQW